MKGAKRGERKKKKTHVWVVEQSIGADVRDGKKVHLHAGRADERESRAHGAGHGDELHVSRHCAVLSPVTFEKVISVIFHLRKSGGPFASP